MKMRAVLIKHEKLMSSQMLEWVPVVTKYINKYRVFPIYRITGLNSVKNKQVKYINKRFNEH